MPTLSGEPAYDIKSRAAGLPETYHDQIIQSQLFIIRRRMRVQAAFTELARCVFCGLLLTGGMMLLARFVRLPSAFGIVTFLPFVLSIIVAIGLSFVRKIPLLVVARFVDKRLDLKERFSTAVELIQQGATDDLARLQISDTASTSAEILPSNAAPYTLPSALKWFPIPVLLILASFTVPRMYALPVPPTLAEQRAIEDTAEVLERMMGEIDDLALITKMQNAIKTLKKADAHTAQDRLSKLRDDIRAQEGLLPVDKIKETIAAVAEVTETSPRFKGKDAGQLAEEVAKHANGQEISPELQAELQSLFNRIAERLVGNPVAKNLTEGLAQLQTKTVSPDTLKRIVRLLEDMDKLAKNQAQLEQIMEQIMTSRKNIALASIEMNRASGTVANTGGGPGEESVTGATQGTNASGNSEFESKKTTDEAEFSTQHTQDESTSALRVEGSELTLTGAASDSEDSSKVFVGGKAPSGENEPEYMPYREVVLNAQQDYAEAVKNDHIPVRYQQQIKDYLTAISNP